MSSGFPASTSVVGYTTKDAPKAAFRLAAISFEGAGDGSLNLNDLVVPGTKTVANNDDGAFLNEAPQVQVQKADGGYNTYYYINNAVYISGYDEGTGDPIVDTKAGWADMFGVLATVEYYEASLAEGPGTVTPGSAVWFKDPSSTGNASLVSSGAVIDSDVSIECPAAFRLRANAFPTDLNLNDTNQVVFAGLADVANEDDGAFLNTAPQIQVQKADGGYNTYYYINNAVYIAGYEEGSGDPIVETKAGWADMFGVLATPEYYEATLAEGPGVATAAFGFWAKGVSKSFTMTFKTPIK